MTQREKDMLDLAKCRIHITTPEGEYEGYVLIVCPVSRKIMVSNILFLPKRTPMGTLDFNFRDILSYKIISRPDANDIKNHNMYAKRSSASAKNTCIIDDCSEADELESIADESMIGLYEEEEFTLKLPPIFSSRIPVDNCLIRHIDEDFHQAVKYVFEQDSIGVGFEGPKVGRNGKLDFVTISTSTCTYIFDIDSLGSDAFKEGLKKIFENPNVEKVIHDCRQPSDCLFQKYDTRLVNVFDTQVADTLVTIQRSQNKISKRVNSIDTCLRTYLEIPEDFIHKPRSFHNFEEEVVYMGLRPLQSERRQVILKNVLYLRLLKRELTLAMLTPFRRAVEVYLNVVQTASDRELLLVPSVPDEVPDELLLEGIQVVRFKEYVDMPPIVTSGPPYRKLKNPVKSYTHYCKELEKTRKFENENELSLSESEDSDKSTSPRLFSVSQGGSPFTYKDNDSSSCESSRNSTIMPHSLISVEDISEYSAPMSPPSIAFGRIAKIPITVRNPNLSPTAKELNSGFKNCESAKSSPDSQSLKGISRLRTKLSTNHLSDSEKSMITRSKSYLPSSLSFLNSEKSLSVFNQEIRKFRGTELSLHADKSRHVNSDSSDSESNFTSEWQSDKDILIDFYQFKKLLSSESTVSPKILSESAVSSDENPWAALKAEFISFDCFPESTNCRFVPA